MSRTKSILAAGSLTGLVLITILALGLRSINADSGTESSSAADSQTRIEIQQPQSGATADEALQSWQTYSSDLENTVQIMQEREAAYQSQIEAANLAIIELQDQVSSANTAVNQMGADTHYDDDEYEHEEYEEDDDHEEHEDHEEREEHEDND